MPERKTALSKSRMKLVDLYQEVVVLFAISVMSVTVRCLKALVWVLIEYYFLSFKFIIILRGYHKDGYNKNFRGNCDEWSYLSKECNNFSLYGFQDMISVSCVRSLVFIRKID